MLNNLATFIYIKSLTFVARPRKVFSVMFIQNPACWRLLEIKMFSMQKNFPLISFWCNDGKNVFTRKLITDKIFLIYKEIQNWIGCKVIYEEMHKYLTIYEEAVNHIWLHPILSDFPDIWGKFYFNFYQCGIDYCF